MTTSHAMCHFGNTPGLDHERHAEMVEWRGPDFDPSIVDVASIEKVVPKLVRRPSRWKTKAPPAKKA